MSTTLLSRLDILLTANASGFREEMQGAADESSSSFDKISSGAKAMAGVLAGAFAVGAIGVWIDETINAAIELDNLAKLANPAPGNRRGESLDVVPRPKELVDGVSSQQASYSVCTCILPFARGA